MTSPVKDLISRIASEENSSSNSECSVDNDYEKSDEQNSNELGNDTIELKTESSDSIAKSLESRLETVTIHDRSSSSGSNCLAMECCDESENDCINTKVEIDPDNSSQETTENGCPSSDRSQPTSLAVSSNLICDDTDNSLSSEEINGARANFTDYADVSEFTSDPINSTSRVQRKKKKKQKAAIDSENESVEEGCRRNRSVSRLIRKEDSAKKVESINIDEESVTPYKNKGLENNRRIPSTSSSENPASSVDDRDSTCSETPDEGSENTEEPDDKSLKNKSEHSETLEEQLSINKSENPETSNDHASETKSWNPETSSYQSSDSKSSDPETSSYQSSESKSADTETSSYQSSESKSLDTETSSYQSSYPETSDDCYMMSLSENPETSDNFSPMSISENSATPDPIERKSENQEALNEYTTNSNLATHDSLENKSENQDAPNESISNIASDNSSELVTVTWENLEPFRDESVANKSDSLKTKDYKVSVPDNSEDEPSTSNKRRLSTINEEISNSNTPGDESAIDTSECLETFTNEFVVSKSDDLQTNDSERGVSEIPLDDSGDKPSNSSKRRLSTINEDIIESGKDAKRSRNDEDMTG